MKWLRYNWGYKLLALAISLTLWGYVHITDGPVERKLPNKKVQLRDMPAGLVPILDRDHVEVTVTGPANRLETLTDDDVDAWLDLKEVGPGRRFHLAVNCAINRDSAQLGCQVVPERLSVRVEERISRTLPVTVFVSGTPPLGYVYARPRAAPSTVTLSGLRRDVSRVNRLVASVAGNGKDVDQLATVLPLDARGDTVPQVQAQPSMVGILAPLRLEPASKELLVNPVTRGRPAEGFAVVGLNTLPLAVVARGEASALANLRAVKTRNVDLTGIEASQTMRVALKPIPGIDFEPDSVNVMIEVQPVQRPAPPSPPSVLKEPARLKVPAH